MCEVCRGVGEYTAEEDDKQAQRRGQQQGGHLSFGHFDALYFKVVHFVLLKLLFVSGCLQFFEISRIVDLKGGVFLYYIFT